MITVDPESVARTPRSLFATCFNGSYEPWICEISPFQLGAMNKTERRRYETQRAADRHAWLEASAAYGQAVREARERGMSPKAMHKDASELVYAWMGQEQEAARKAAEQAHYKAQYPKTAAELPVGSVLLYGRQRVEVVKQSPKSIQVRDIESGRKATFGPNMIACGALRWNSEPFTA